MNPVTSTIVITLASYALSEPITIPQNACFWRGASYGTMVYCEDDEIAVGACGSGLNDDCDPSQWVQLLCCRVPDYFYNNCYEYGGTHGEKLECPALSGDDNFSLVEGVCGSGFNNDCRGGSDHIARCCNGNFNDGKKISSTGTCYWTYGYYGEKIRCGRDDEAVFGSCGSGRTDDCGTKKWSGIQCCQIEKL